MTLDELLSRDSVSWENLIDLDRSAFLPILCCLIETWCEYHNDDMIAVLKQAYLMIRLKCAKQTD